MQRNTYFEDEFVKTLNAMLELVQQQRERQKKQLEYERARVQDRSPQKEMDAIRDDADRQLIYDILYYHAKSTYPEWFQVSGKNHQTFPLENGKISIVEQPDGFVGVLHRNGYDPYRMTPHFNSQSEVLNHLFQTEKFERVHGDTLFKADGNVFSLLQNSKLFAVAPGEEIGREIRERITYTPSMEKARLNARIAEFERENGEQIRVRTFKDYLKKNHFPEELAGKEVVIEDVNPPKVTVSKEDKEYEVRLPDLGEGQWKEHIRVTFDEIALSSASFAEGFLEFYGIELMKEVEQDTLDFQVYGDENGYFVGHLRDNGELIHLSDGYLTNEESAMRDLQALKEHMDKEPDLVPQVESVDIHEEREIDR